MAQQSCSVFNCSSTRRKNPDLSFHIFPKEGEKIQVLSDFGIAEVGDRRKLWEINLKIGNKITNSMAVCSRHFTQDDYECSGWSSRKRLKQTAVPSRNLPSSTLDIERNKEIIKERRTIAGACLREERSKVSECPAKHITEMYSCNKCPSKFKLLVALQTHAKTAHKLETFDCASDLRPFQCGGCENFRTHFRTQLKQHIRQNHAFQGTQISYTCRTCYFETFSRCVLLRHIYLDRCVYEPVKIGSELTTKHVFIDMRVVQWFKCEFCPFQAQFKGNLRIHQRKFHSVDSKRLKCDLCPFETLDKMMFDRHIQVHLTLEPEGEKNKDGSVRIGTCDNNDEGSMKEYE
ncbi:hypothetical protein Zmor_019893 [Zophobas morio]|uniref:Uncharacterized protein n=1 Tax=Zophobas morio TaxID=2755281 RepID=A0AA38I5T3_9CUCU|nr:hypothetical protein Zmor_019893 [Zophobas morio]